MNFGLSKKVERPFFSVIIPVYNGSATINFCLSKIVEQSFTDFEIIVIDGLSKDDTLIQVLEFKKKYNFIKVISEQDSGVYDAMNKGIATSQGRYLYFLGCDDSFFDVDVLRDVHTKIQSEGFPDLIYGNVLWGDTNVIYNGEYDLAKLYYSNICHQSIFYERGLFDKIGNYDLNYPVCADWLFNFKCFSNRFLSIRYCNLLIAKFGLAGLSRKTADPLNAQKNQIFVFLAKNSRRRDYLNFRRCTVDKSTIYGKVQYLSFYLMFILCDLFEKARKN